jgi:hypothetical protein
MHVSNKQKVTLLVVNKFFYFFCAFSALTTASNC